MLIQGKSVVLPVLKSGSWLCNKFEGSVYETSCGRALQLDPSPVEMPELCCIYSADSVALMGILDRGLVVCAA